MSKEEPEVRGIPYMHKSRKKGYRCFALALRELDNGRILMTTTGRVHWTVTHEELADNWIRLK